MFYSVMFGVWVCFEYGAGVLSWGAYDLIASELFCVLHGKVYNYNRIKCEFCFCRYYLDVVCMIKFFIVGFKLGAYS